MNVCLAILRLHSDGMSDYMFILLFYANTMQKGEVYIPMKFLGVKNWGRGVQVSKFFSSKGNTD